MKMIALTERIGKVVYSEEPFYDALMRFQEKYEPINFADLAYLSLMHPERKKYPCLVMEGAIFTKEKQIILTRRSPIISNVDIAERCNRTERSIAGSYDVERFTVDEAPYLRLVELDQEKETEQRRAIIIN